MKISTQVKNGKGECLSQIRIEERFIVSFSGSSSGDVSIQFNPNPNCSFLIESGEKKVIEVGEIEANGFTVECSGAYSGTLTMETE